MGIRCFSGTCSASQGGKSDTVVRKRWKRWGDIHALHQKSSEIMAHAEVHDSQVNFRGLWCFVLCGSWGCSPRTHRRWNRFQKDCDIVDLFITPPGQCLKECITCTHVHHTALSKHCDTYFPHLQNHEGHLLLVLPYLSPCPPILPPPWSHQRPIGTAIAPAPDHRETWKTCPVGRPRPD